MTLPSKTIIQPRRIRLDAATACQLKCPSCPTASGETGKKLGVGFLKFEDFKHVVDRNGWVSQIELSNWGEVFLNKDLAKIFQYAYQKNVAVSIANGTNLNTVHEGALEALVKYKIRKVSCSIDGASQETYAIYRVKGNFDRVIENVKTINKWKAHYRSEYPQLRWQYVVFGHNEHEIQKARDMAHELNMEFYVKLSWGDLYTEQSFSPVKDGELIRKESGLGAADRQEYREKTGKDYGERLCCLSLWSGPQINHDGRVLGCCINYWEDYGNAFKDGLKECLNNEKITTARAVLMGHGVPGKGIPCTTCKVYGNMLKHNNWITPDEIKAEYHPKGRFYNMVENKVLGEAGMRHVMGFLSGAKSRLKKILVQPHVERRGSIKSGVYPLAVPLKADYEKGWRAYPVFRGQTGMMDDLACHASALVPGHTPHPPHTHKEEEILILLAGEVDLQLPALEKPVRLTPGQFVYYPTGFLHTLQPVGELPANYLMFKWQAGPSGMEGRPLTFKLFDPNAIGPGTKEGFAPSLLFEGPTQYLKKLHSHVSTLSPGAGYKPHKDAYDVVLVVLEGEVETLGRRAGPHSIIFYPAGEPHGIANPGTRPAKYLVFEFHR